MSTNKTPNYQLHSWLPTDDFRFHEVNENFTALDAALKSECSALTAALIQEAAERSKKSEVVFGSYMGTAQPVHLELGCVPKAMLVMRSTVEAGTAGSRYFGLLIPGMNNPGAVFEGTGVTLSSGEGQILSYLNAEHHYILFL